MKKTNLMLIFGLCIFLGGGSMHAQEEMDFDTFLKEFFGAPMAGEEPGAAPARPSFFGPQEEKPAEPEEKEAVVAEDEVTTQLRRLKELLTFVTDATKEERFDIDFREKVLREIQGKKELRAKPEPKEGKKQEGRDKKEEPEKILYKDQGADGLRAAINWLLARHFYQRELSQEAHKELRQDIARTVQKLEGFSERIKNLPEPEKKPEPAEAQVTKAKFLAELYEPKRSRRKKRVLQNDLVIFFKNLPELTGSIETFINSDSVRKIVQEKWEKRRKLEAEAGRDRSGWTGDRGRGRDRGPGREEERPWWPWWGDDWQDDDRWPQDKKPATKKAAKAPEKDDGVGWGVPGKKKEDKKDKKEKEELKAGDIIALMQSAARLLNEVGSTVEPRTLILDPTLKEKLVKKNRTIVSLHEKVAQIETEKNNPKFAKDKTRSAWKKAEKEYHNAFVRNIGTLALLSKCGQYEFEQTQDGRFTLLTGVQPQQRQRGQEEALGDTVGKPVLISQAALRDVYGLVHKALSKDLKDKAARTERQMVQLITNQIKQQFARIFARASDPSLDLGDEHLLDYNQKVLDVVHNLLVDTLRLLLTARNTPLPIAIKPGPNDMNIERLAQDIKYAENFAKTRFSPALHKSLSEYMEALVPAHIPRTIQQMDSYLENEYKKMKNKAETLLRARRLIPQNGEFEEFILRYASPRQDARWNNGPEAQLRQTLAGTRREFRERELFELNEYRRKAQYHIAAENLNTFDKNIKLTQKIRALAGREWNIPAPDKHDIEIVEALWGDVAVVNNEIVVLEPGTCDVQTEAWQEVIDHFIQHHRNLNVQPVPPWLSEIINPAAFGASRIPLQTRLIDLSERMVEYLDANPNIERNLLAMTETPNSVLVVRYKLHGQEGIATLQRDNDEIEVDPDPEEYGNERQEALRDMVNNLRTTLGRGDQDLRQGGIDNDARRLLELRQQVRRERLAHYERLLPILLAHPREPAPAQPAVVAPAPVIVRYPYPPGLDPEPEEVDPELQALEEELAEPLVPEE